MKSSHIVSLGISLALSPTPRTTQLRNALDRARGRSIGPSSYSLSDPTRLADALDAALRLDVLPMQSKALLRTACRIIVGRSCSDEHSQITAQLLEVADAEDQLNNIEYWRLFTLARAARSAGLFVAGNRFEQIGLCAFHAHAQRLNGVRGLLQRTRSSLAIGDIDQASDFAQKLTRYRSARRAEEVHATLQYVSHVNPTATSSWLPAEKRHTPLRRLVEGKSVLVYGPGPTGSALDNALLGGPIARVLRRGITWDSANDLAENRVDVAYANFATSAWLATLTPTHLIELLSPFQLVALKGRGLRERRITSVAAKAYSVNRWPTYVDGSPNMVPIILWDMLASGAASIHVIGTSFFLGEDAYRSDQLSIDSVSEERRDPQGSTGTQFSVCKSLALHNPSVGRQFVKNLILSGRINGDKSFVRALELTDVQYARELDVLYGIPRI